MGFTVVVPRTHGHVLPPVFYCYIPYKLPRPLTVPENPSSEQMFHFILYCGMDEWITHEAGPVLLNKQHDG